MDKDQERRERAYRIWEDEGRPHGKHDDHWQRSEDQHAQAKPMRTEANKHASEEFNDTPRKIIRRACSATVDGRVGLTTALTLRKGRHLPALPRDMC
jgi:hypothetical protein